MYDFGPIRCDHCGTKTLYRAWVPWPEGPEERIWQCELCGCSWALTGEFRLASNRCAVLISGLVAPSS